MIGLIDYNFIASQRKLPYPSLGALKLSKFLKKEQKDEIRLLTAIEQAKNCNKVFFFSDEPAENLPKEIFLWDEITIYGKYFTPLPQIVEHQIPDIGLYKEVLQKKIADNEIKVEQALSFLESAYYQAFGENGEILPIPPIKTRKKFYLYDEDFLAKENYENVLDKIEMRSPSSIFTIYPLHCRTIKQFLSVRRDHQTLSRTNQTILDYFVPLQQLEVYFSKYRIPLLGEITKNSNVCVYIGKNYIDDSYGDTFYFRNIYYCLTLVCSYWSRKIPIKVEVFYRNDQLHGFSNIMNKIRSWTTSSNWDLTLQNHLPKKDWETLITKDPSFAKFAQVSKNKLFNEQTLWRIT